jgi:HlyD family secretion protein
MIRNKTHYIIYLVLLLASLLISCSSDNTTLKKGTYSTLKVNATPTTDILYFTGSVKPLHVYTVTSPADSTVESIAFNYGQQISKNGLLLTLTSTQLQQDYQTALAEFLKAKEQFNTNKVQMEGNEELNTLGIISKNEYINSKNSFNDANLAYLQAKQKLINLLAKTSTSDKSITELDISNAAAIHEALSKAMYRLNIYAPASGIVLVPEKSSSGSSESGGSTQKLTVGTQVKNGQLLVSIGDMTGIYVEMNANEVDVNRLKPGQAATITGIGFSEHALKGVVQSVDVQATPSTGNNTPTFPIRIAVPHLTQQQQQIIHVGMSAKAEVVITHPALITIPITAVIQKGPFSFVRVINQSTGKMEEVRVKTLHTSLTEVEVDQGLKSGDEIVIPH